MVEPDWWWIDDGLGFPRKIWVIMPPEIISVQEWVISWSRSHLGLGLVDLLLNIFRVLMGRWTVSYQMVRTWADATNVLVLVGWGGSSSSLQKSVKFLWQFIYLAIDIYSMTYFINATPLGCICESLFEQQTYGAENFHLRSQRAAMPHVHFLTWTFLHMRHLPFAYAFQIGHHKNTGPVAIWVWHDVGIF